MDKYMHVQQYIIPFCMAFIISVVMTWVVRKLAIRRNIVDHPEAAPDRKIQKKSIPLLGGAAIFIAVTVVVGFYAICTDRMLGGYMLPKYLIGMWLGGLLLMIGGWLDDRHPATPGQQIVWPILATMVVIASGIGISYITNPFGGTIRLDSISFTLFTVNGIPYHIVLIADVFGFFWLMGMMYTTKFLDGLDGLVSGITTVGAVILFFLSLTKDVAQPETALLSVILAGACAGFLVFNFNPAKIYLGEGGSLFTGFMLGTLSVISGAKIATALLIMGIPILDVVWVIVRRLFIEKKSPFRTADRKHLHFRLLDAGFSHRGAVLFLYVVSAAFGAVALFSGSRQKLIALLVLVVLMIGLAALIIARYRHQQKQSPPLV